MGKRCDCGGVVDMLERDPRLRALPLAARMLWFQLVRAMQAAGLSALRFGCVVPEAREIALLVAVTETELEANLEPILRRGLLVRDADGALASPLLEASRARSEINRANGLKGGRPKRAMAAARNGQGEIMLPIPGGMASAKSESEPGAASAGSAAKLELQGSSGSLAEATRIADAAREAAGIGAGATSADVGSVRKWLAAGAGEALILRTIVAKAKPDVGHLGYFARAIDEALQAPAVSEGISMASAAFRRDVVIWQQSDKEGPIPHPSQYAADGTRIAA